MGYIQFDKDKLINLTYSLNKELLRTNRKGSYAATTLIRCNTRKYHGLLVAPQPAIDDELHVLLSVMDPTIIQHGTEFNLGIHQYPDGVFVPKGHKYVRELHSDPIPKITYRVGGVVFSVETIFSKEADRILLRYTLVDCHSETTIRLKPYLAFRQRHALSKANEWANKKYNAAGNGVSFKLYQGYSELFLQFSKKVDYIHVPDWYYNIEYIEEQRRGYDSREDLLVPGYFEFNMKKGESVILSAGLDEINPQGLKRLFAKEFQHRIPRDSFEHCLMNSAEQFIQRRNKKTKIIAGFPWFGSWGRDSFISLPGLALATQNNKLYKEVFDTMIKNMQGPLFPNVGDGKYKTYASVDASLWFIWAVQQYISSTQDLELVRKSYYKVVKKVLEGYKKGTDYGIHMAENHLIWAGEQGKALTWMDAVVNGKPVTPRKGFAVEINALWYNAVMFALELAQHFDDRAFIESWTSTAKAIPESFNTLFWDNEHDYLADYVDGDYTDWSVRPNMILVTSLPYSPVNKKIKQLVLKKAKDDLMTIRGLRSLSPRNPNYKSVCTGSQHERDNAYHQGTVWPWFFAHFAEGYLKVHGKSGLRKMQWYLEQFEDVMSEHGIGSISEIYDGDPPHKARGCISQAWSVAEIYRAKIMIEKYLNN